MGKKLREELENLKTYSLEELSRKREEIQIDRCNLETQLMDAEDHGQTSSDWYIKASYAFRAKGIILNNINTLICELNREKRETFYKVFHETAMISLPFETYKRLKTAVERNIEANTLGKY